MKYISCSWMHKNIEYPIWLLSELDDENYETRKIEIYLDGEYGYADKIRSFNGTELGGLPVPNIEEININIEFNCTYIDHDKFEKYWGWYVMLKD